MRQLDSTLQVTMTFYHSNLSSILDIIYKEYSTHGGRYNFICPSNTSTLTMQPIEIQAEPTGKFEICYKKKRFHASSYQESGNFIIYVDGWTQSSVVVLKLDDDVVVECAHAIVPPEKGITQATGGVLTLPDNQDSEEGTRTGDSFIIVCSGEEVNLVPNDMCTILRDQRSEKETAAHSDGSDAVLSAGGFLNNDRIGAASLVIDKGTSLWVLGGSDGDNDVQKDSEIVTIVGHDNNSSIVFQTNLVGHNLPQKLVHHCLVAIGPEVAIATGGKKTGK